MRWSGSGLNLLDKDWPIYARAESEPPAYLGGTAEVDHSVVTRGSEVEGAVRNSVLSQRCTVAEGAEVEYSILMPGAVVKKGAVVAYAIVAENAVIGKNCVIGKRPEDMENRDDWGVAVVGPDCKLSEGTVVAPKEMIDKEAQA